MTLTALIFCVESRLLFLQRLKQVLCLSAFAMTKHMLQLGSNLTVITSREHMIFTSSCLRDKLYDCLDILIDVARNPAHKHWEVRDLVPPSLKLDVANYHNDPTAMV